ncbi:hypothetical protein HYQ46_006215 [Verticillium longisporum]|nr:hypothetical protein HYQ46_006215 [Verticillium longisporum]
MTEVIIDSKKAWFVSLINTDSRLFEDSLQQRGQQHVQNIINLRLETKHDLVKKAQEHGHLVLGRALAEEPFNPLGQLRQHSSAQNT